MPQVRHKIYTLSATGSHGLRTGEAEGRLYLCAERKGRSWSTENNVTGFDKFKVLLRGMQK